MSAVRVDYAAGSRLIPVSTRVTFGRAAMIRLTGPRGQKDLNMHAEAFGLTAEGTGWVLDVDGDHREVVVTQIGGRGVRERVQGERKKFFWAAAEICIATQLHIHRVNVTSAETAWPASDRSKAGMTAPSWEPDLELLADRLLVALCGERLDRLDAPALPYTVAIAAVSGGGREEDANINTATAKTKVHRRLPVVEAAIQAPVHVNDRLDRRLDAVVDWLVATNSVTRAHYRAVCGPARR